MFIRHLQVRLAIAVCLSLCAAGCAEPESTSDATPPAALSVAVVGLQHATQYQRQQLLTGRVEANRLSDVGFELPGQLASVAVDEGDNVTAGQVLAALGTERLAARRAEAAAQLAQADTQVRLAKSTFDRIEEALSFRGVSQQEFDEAQNALASFRAAANAARSRLDSIDVDVSKSELVAPFDAVVTARHVDEGQVLPSGQPVLSLQERGRLTARIGVAGPALDFLTPGSTQTLHIQGSTLDATIRQRLAQRDQIARTVDVLFDLITTDHSIRAGDLARLTVTETIDARGAWLPLDALAEGSRGLWTVYVAVPQARQALGATHRLQPRPINIIYQDGDKAYVNGALDDGDQVVVSGLHRIVPGQFVRLDARASMP